MPDYNILSQSPVFTGLTPARIETLLKAKSFQMRRYNKDELVASRGEKIQMLSIIQKGSVRGEMMDYAGKTLKIEDIEAPRPIASAFLFGKNNNYPVTVIANCEVEILNIQTTAFLALMQHETQVLVNYLNAISSRTQFLSQKLYFLSFSTIKGKIAHFLLQEAGPHLHSVELKQTQQQLADLFGVTRPSLSRVLGELQRDAIIKIDNKTIVLLNKQKLNQLIQHE